VHEKCCACRDPYTARDRLTTVVTVCCLICGVCVGDVMVLLGLTWLFHALQGPPDIAAVKQLLAAGADVNSRDFVGYNCTPLHVLAAKAFAAAFWPEPRMFTEALCGPKPPQVRHLLHDHWHE
jgi:hypothetical protein